MSGRTGTAGLCLCIMLTVSATAADTIVDLDMVYVQSAGVPRVFDHFDDAVLGDWWFVLGGEPGPETGTVLEMRPGDTIFTPMITDPAETTFAIATMNLTEFGSGSATAMFLTGDEPGDMLALGIVPGFAFLVDEDGLLGFAVLDLGESATLTVTSFGESGVLVASVNEELVFLGTNTLGTADGIGFVVVPEPTTATQLAPGLLVVGWARRR